MFHITVSPFDTYSINWTIAFTDILIIDEISQISVPIFNHILTTVNVLPVRPIVLLCGDFAQQQPLATIDGSIRQVPSIVHHPFIVSSCYTVNLTSQYRIHDKFLLSFLHHIRYYRPTPDLLATLQRDRVLSTADIVTETINQSIFHHHPTYFFLTISSAASDFINTSIMSSQSHSPPLCTVPCTPDLLSVPLYNGLPIMLLENRDKSNGFVNDQLCTVHYRVEQYLLIIHMVTLSTSIPSHPLHPLPSITHFVLPIRQLLQRYKGKLLIMSFYGLIHKQHLLEHAMLHYLEFALLIIYSFLQNFMNINLHLCYSSNTLYITPPLPSILYIFYTYILF